MALMKNEIENQKEKQSKLVKVLEGHQKEVQLLENTRRVPQTIKQIQDEYNKIKINIKELKNQQLFLVKDSKLKSINLAQLKQIFREVCKQAKIPPIFEDEPQIDENLKAQKKKQRIVVNESFTNKIYLQLQKKENKADEIALEARRAKQYNNNANNSNNFSQSYQSRSKLQYIPKFKQQKIQSILNEVDEENNQELEVTENKLIEYKTKIIVLKKQYEQNKKNHEQEMKMYQDNIKELSLQQKDLLNREKEKEAESRISLAKFNEYKRITNHKSPKDYSFSIYPIKETKELYLQKRYWQKELLECKYRPTKRELIGDLPENYPLVFDDIEQIGIAKDFNQRAYKISIYHDLNKRNIFGFQIFYFDNNTGEEKQGQKNIYYKNINHENVSQTTLEINNTDSLRFISGYCKEKINYLKFETQQGESIAVGHANSREKYKEFHLELKQNDLPILFFGVLDQEKNCTGYQNYVLISFGVEIFNPIYNYNSRHRSLYNQMNSSKLIDQSQMIEEDIIVEKENSLLNGRRGLFQNRIKPLMDNNKKKKLNL